MSLETWKEEFAPQSLRGGKYPTDPVEAAAASLRRWIGLLSCNAAKHGLDARSRYYAYSDSGCSLCVVYHKYTFFKYGDCGPNDCTGCPLDTLKYNCFEDFSPYDKAANELLRRDGSDTSDTAVLKLVKALTEAFIFQLLKSNGVAPAVAQRIAKGKRKFNPDRDLGTAKAA